MWYQKMLSLNNLIKLKLLFISRHFEVSIWYKKGWIKYIRWIPQNIVNKKIKIICEDISFENKEYKYSTLFSKLN